MPTKKAKIVSKYQKTNKMLDIIKTYKLMNMPDKSILDAIQFHTGQELSLYQLGELVELAKREIREQQIEVDRHMEHMVKFGLYVDTMNSHEILVTLEQMIFGEVLAEQNKPADLKNMNKILAMANTLKNIISAKDTIVTNIGFLAKTRNIFENRDNDDNNKPPAIELNRKTNIMIKDQKTDVNKLIDQVIDKKELENNRVA
ncbi:MAG: hypothetical protein ACHQ1D_08480 [Nitrososphaerales archaeon]|jgi:hypothetical protein